MILLALTRNTDCTSRHVRSFLNPYNRKARCSAERGDTSHSSYSCPLAPRDVLLVKSNLHGVCESEVVAVQFYSYHLVVLPVIEIQMRYIVKNNTNVIEQSAAGFG
jgi:hypothetical protein